MCYYYVIIFITIVLSGCSLCPKMSPEFLLYNIQIENTGRLTHCIVLTHGEALSFQHMYSADIFISYEYVSELLAKKLLIILENG